eukprot:COSAG02_NODE_42574_length_383_cov_0.894366_2_plen_82_part_00
MRCGVAMPCARHSLRQIDPTADVSDLDMMAAHAEHEAASRREEVNARVPPFASIVAKVHDYAGRLKSCILSCERIQSASCR